MLWKKIFNPYQSSLMRGNHVEHPDEVGAVNTQFFNFHCPRIKIAWLYSLPSFVREQYVGRKLGSSRKDYYFGSVHKYVPPLDYRICCNCIK